MKEKFTSLVKNKYLLFFLPLILLILLLSFEWTFDKVAGDGDGVISLPLFIKFKYVFKIICILWLIVNVSVFAVKNRELVKNEKVKRIINNKPLRFFLPVIIMILLLFIEKKTGSIIAEGYGKYFILTLWLIFNMLTILFRMEKKVAVFNLAFLMIILYGFNFYLKKQDPFLKGPFDSNFYFGNKAKYENSITPPEGYDKDGFLTWGKKVVRNKHGFRDDPITFKPKGVLRVMVLGDSFTWGAGLAENEKYSWVLDSMLNAYFKGNPKIDVVNCALSGSPTVRERDILRELKDTVQPDMVVVGFCVNDPQPKSEDWSEEKEAFEKKWSNLLTAVDQDFSFFRLNYIGEKIRMGIYNLLLKTAHVPTWEEALGRVYDPSSKDWKNFTGALKDIKNMCDSMQCPPPIIGIFNQATSIDFHSTNEAEIKRLQGRMAWHKEVYDAATQAGFIAIDYAPAIDKEVVAKRITPQNANVNPLDGHPSAYLNRIFAQGMFERLKPQIENKLKSSQTELTTK